jgi:hypothetical protein
LADLLSAIETAARAKLIGPQATDPIPVGRRTTLRLDITHEEQATMPSVTRRGFIKRTSLSVAAIGALSAIAPFPALADTLAQNQTQAQPMRGPDPKVSVPALNLVGGEPFVVYISDPSTGAGTILVGEQAIPFTNGAIVQSLRQAIG